MKNIVNNLMVASLVMMATFTSCNRDDKDDIEKGVVKLVESITSSHGSGYMFVYDAQNRITKITFYRSGSSAIDNYIATLAYSGNDLTKITYVYPNNPIWNREEVFVRNGNTITSSSTSFTNTFTVNKDGYPTNSVKIFKDFSSETIYQYQGGNLIKRTISSTGAFSQNDDETVFQYDNKKSPFYHCKTPKWFLINHFIGTVGMRLLIGVHNNIIAAIEGFTAIYSRSLKSPFLRSPMI